MENKSLIQGTTWYWRKTFMNVLMHSSGRFSGGVDVKELCLVVNDSEKRQQLTKELANAQIQIQKKEVHLNSDHIPEGSTILYMREPNKNIEDEESDFEDTKQNLQKLKDYIFQNGGKIDGEVLSNPIKKSFFSFFGFKGR